MSLPPSRPDQKFSSPEATDPFPQNTFLIKSAEQKGLGLATLRKPFSMPVSILDSLYVWNRPFQATPSTEDVQEWRCWLRVITIGARNPWVRY